MKPMFYQNVIPKLCASMDTVVMTPVQSFKLARCSAEKGLLYKEGRNIVVFNMPKVCLPEFVLRIEPLDNEQLAFVFQRCLRSGEDAPSMLMSVLTDDEDVKIVGLFDLGDGVWAVKKQDIGDRNEILSGVMMFAAIQKCAEYPDAFEIEERRVKKQSKGKKGKPNKGGRKVQIIKQYRLVRDVPLVGKKGKHKINCPSWSVRGHYRHYKSGKVVFIESYRKGKKRDQFSPKEYGIAIPKRAGESEQE